jgi:hypothetical protein
MDGKYPLVTGLEHDEMGHPTGSPKLHMAMTAKRRTKLQKLAEELPVPKVYGGEDGEILLIGWGSTYGPIHDAVKQARARGDALSAIHLRHIHPLPNGLENIFANFKRIVVVEMNDQGIYGYGQLATILRARYCEPKITSLTKTDGLTFRVKEILEGLGGGYGVATQGTLANGASGNGATTSEATRRAEATVSPARDRSQDVTPTKPGTEAVHASAGKLDHSKHPPSERAEDAAIAVSGSGEQKAK